MPPTTSLKQLPVTLCNKQKSSNTFVNLWKLTETRRSFRKLHTVDELREFVDNNEISLIDYMISTIDEDVSTAAGRSRYVAKGAEILSHVSDGVIFDNCVKLLALESLSSLSTVREAVGKVDEMTEVCRKCSNIDESLKCSGSVVPVVSRCCALDDDGCGVGVEEVLVVAQPSFLDDGTRIVFLRQGKHPIAATIRSHHQSHPSHQFGHKNKIVVSHATVSKAASQVFKRHFCIPLTHVTERL